MVPPNRHRSNIDEQAKKNIQKLFYCSIVRFQSKFPITIFYRFLDQSTKTLNLMRKSIFNPNISVHEQLLVIFNFNCTSFSPPGKIFLVHYRPENRSTYAPHGSYVWYIGKSPIHYACFKCYMTSTK